LRVKLAPHPLNPHRGTASGKTTFCEKIKLQIPTNCSIFGFDSFYKGLPPGTNSDDYDFDHPNAIDFEDAYQCLLELKSGYDTSIPIYDFTLHKRLENSQTLIKWNEFIIIEGIFAFYDEVLIF
jgi:uridine kinase